MTFDVIDQNFSTVGLNQNPYTSIDLALDQNNDLIILPNGYLDVVTGNLKLQQDIRLFLLSPQGSCIADSRWGNAAVNLIGQAPATVSVLESAINGSLLTLKNFKDQEEISRGYPLENSELIASIQDVSITSQDGMSWNVVVTVFDKNHSPSTYNIALNVI